jgi:hypothetical protein
MDAKKGKERRSGVDFVSSVVSPFSPQPGVESGHWLNHRGHRGHREKQEESEYDSLDAFLQQPNLKVDHQADVKTGRFQVGNELSLLCVLCGFTLLTPAASAARPG